ncbi:olfactory receptor 52E4-like [Ambystoma mexicanum]|uniref:olfactory receptor 52E4-like n=1 Tax=Ambystoma mexicanum TaxID=8296 RepID=UPI0037E7BD7C
MAASLRYSYRESIISPVNDTGFTPSTLVLMGIPGLERFHVWFAAPLCIIYIITLLANSTLLIAIKTVTQLHKPMYLFISQQALSDLTLSSCIIPKILGTFWLNDGEISFSGCLVQMYFVALFSAFKSSILLAMAFDRYVAVCKPLRYNSIVTNSLIAKIWAVCLGRAMFLVSPAPLLLLRIPYCSRYIASSDCEHMAVAKLSCADITLNSVYALVTSLFMGSVDISGIAMSYILILRTVLHLPKEDRVKAFSTCGSHICVLSVSYIPYFFTIIFHRLRNGIPLYAHVIVSRIYLIFPPMVNPLIYGGTMKEVRQGVLQVFRKIKDRMNFCL